MSNNLFNNIKSKIKTGKDPPLGVFSQQSAEPSNDTGSQLQNHNLKKEGEEPKPKQKSRSL